MRSSIDIIEKESDPKHCCVTNEKFDNESMVVTYVCDRRDQVYYMEEDNVEYFKSCYTDYHMDFEEAVPFKVEIPYNDKQKYYDRGIAPQDGVIR